MSNSTENVTARQRPNARPEVDDLELGNGGGVNSEKEKSSANSVSDQPGMLSANPKSAGMESARRARDAITEQLEDGAEEIRKFWGVFMRKDKPKIGVVQSLRSFFFSTWLNIFLVCIPIAWVSHFKHWDSKATFVLSFFAIVPLERTLDYGGEQMSFYLGKDLGDLAMVTLNNAVEATLALILLKRCELVLLKSTIIGVVILHLLLVPGTAFITGGARIIQQDLHPHLTQLNHTLLTIGVLSLLLPAAFFAAINTTFDPAATAAAAAATATATATAAAEGAAAAASNVTSAASEIAASVVTDDMRHIFLQMSRGLAILLLVVYVCSRIYLHDPPGEDDDLASAPMAPEAFKDHVARLKEEDPEVNQFVAIVVIAVAIGLLAATAEWLVESIDFVREESNIQTEWFGLILLPIVSFAADGTVAAVYFIRHTLRLFFSEGTPPQTLAKGEAIDLSIQFTLFWMPFFVLVGWWTDKPLTLLFDLFEVACLIGATFIVNYVTADSKTNWAEGMAMVIFYVMIALCSWFYPGQPEIAFLSQCESVAAALLGGGLED
jgi:Ca2+:H+ antiporter